METGGMTAIEIIGWVLAVNAVLILAALGLISLMRRQCQESIVEIGKQIEVHAVRMDDIALFLQAYSAVDQEPFSTPLDQLQQEATGIRTRLEQFLANCRAFEEQVNNHPTNNQLQDIINAPFQWFQRWRQSKELLQESAEISDALGAAEEHAKKINELPWDLSTQCRQVEKDVTELALIARELQSKGVRGASLQTILNQLPLLERSIDEIPQEFLQSEHNELLAAANLDSTVRVFEILNRTQPFVARWLPQAREWQVHHQKASADYVELKQAGATLRQTLSQQPPGLATAPIQARLDQVAQLAHELNQRLSQPDAEQLKHLARETARLGKVIQDTEHQLNRAVQRLTELNLALEEQNAALERLSTQFAALEHSESYPLVLDESGVVLNDLRQRVQFLGPAHQPREPEVIVRHLKELEGIRDLQKNLAEQAPGVAEQHRALVALLESPEIRDGAAWLRKARDTAAQTYDYDPINWPKQDAVASLTQELDDLEQKHRLLAPVEPTTPFKESELGQRLKDTQQLVAVHKALRPRVDSIRGRLEKIKAMEEEGKEKLTGSWTALERVAILAENNELLETIAAADIERLGEEIRQLSNELNNQSQGEIEKKLQRINAQTDKVTKSMNAWLARLNAAVTDCGKKVYERLVQVENAATLEDSPVQEARSLLSREDFTAAALSGPTEKLKTVAKISAAARGAREASLGTLEATGEIKRKNDLWLTLLAVQTALEEKSAPVLAAAQEVAQTRVEAREALTALGTRVPSGTRAWPPSNQVPLTEAQALKPIDDRWEAMRKQRGSAEWAVNEMQRLAQQYLNLAERAHQIQERAVNDQERVAELEWQVEDVKQRWQRQAQAASNNPVIREGVQQLLSQTDSRLSYIKHQYMREALSYEQVIQNLQLLYDELFSARVSVDATTDIGLNDISHYTEQSNGRPIS